VLLLDLQLLEQAGGCGEYVPGVVQIAVYLLLQLGLIPQIAFQFVAGLQKAREKKGKVHESRSIRAFRG